MMFDFFRIDDLTINGVQGEAYRDALDLAGIGPSPLEQFAILPLIPIQIGDFSFSFTNPSLFMLLTLGLVLLLISFVTKKGGESQCQMLGNPWWSFGNVKQSFPLASRSLLLFRYFVIPRLHSDKSFSHYFGSLIFHFYRHYDRWISKTWASFFSFSLPAGVPLPLAPFLVLLELIPHCFRALSSGIRLFAI
ncbi:hypothetical protein IEQ34_024195 [Dendrobium chrysotoxum]|uniref:F-ATPase protein 6 n=1 Tax=Dendrobium chrysotoxum TaxID=161865 RepID=A0AAV7FU68_DENCH|nr:hypothetical protein IEQ34_024195 [Dendrobium chrysotoxum]